MNTKERQIRLVAQQAVSAMVGQHIKVSVGTERLLPAAPRNTGAALVEVEMTGPSGAPDRGSLTTSIKAEAAAWGIDEVVSASRRAAARILAKNPTWRRVGF